MSDPNFDDLREQAEGKYQGRKLEIDQAERFLNHAKRLRSLLEQGRRFSVTLCSGLSGGDVSFDVTPDSADYDALVQATESEIASSRSKVAEYLER